MHVYLDIYVSATSLDAGTDEFVCLSDMHSMLVMSRATFV
jgi:hypothetical protein